jgi:hypothetical protein
VVIWVHGSTGPQAHKTPIVGFAINDQDQMGEGYSPLLIMVAGGGSVGKELTPLWERRLRTEHGGTGVISSEIGWGGTPVD